MASTADEPTMGEVIRRLDAIAAQLTEVVKEIKDDRAQNAATFVRQDVYHANRKADQAVVANLNQDIGGLQADRKADAAWRRQSNLTLAVLAISSLVSIALALTGLLTR